MGDRSETAENELGKTVFDRCSVFDIGVQTVVFFQREWHEKNALL